ncbi:MAG: hypothetical protein ACOCQ3_00470 [Natronomonas sp.]
MKITRRNTIIGLGVLAGGAGVIGGTGAFDVVEAERNFAIEVDADADALLGLTATNDAIATEEPGGAGDSPVIVFQLDGSDGINEDAVTTFLDAFEISNNGSQLVAVAIDTGGAEGVRFLVESDPAEDLADATVEFAVGDARSIDIEIDTTESGGYEDTSGGYDMVITAESENA